MKSSICIMVACLVWLFVEVSVAELQIFKKLRAAERFVEDLNGGEFDVVVQNVSSTMSQHLNVLSNVITVLAANNTACNQSGEIEYLRDLSVSINQKLDDVISQFQTVKILAHWNESIYAKYETSIHAVFNQFKLLFMVPSVGINHQEQLFVKEYERTYPVGGDHLFLGFAIGNGFISPAMNYTKHNRGQMRTFMLSILKPLIMAADIEVAYSTIARSDTVILSTINRWQARFEAVQRDMKEIDLDLKNNYITQANKDIDIFSNNNLELSNPMFARFLYQELSKKYFWRDWLVVVSTHTEGYHDAHSRTCNGVIKSTHNRKDLVIDSVNKDKTPLNIQDVNQTCKSLQISCNHTVFTTINTCNEDPTETRRIRSQSDVIYHSANADVVFNWITKFGTSCSPISSYGVIDTHKNPVHYAAGPTDDSPNRLFVCDLGVCNYFVHFFG